MTSGIDALLDRTRRRIVRVGPHNAAALAATGAVLVDTRPVELRIAHGEIPGALIIDRNVLEWRLDPRSPWRHAAVTDDPPPIIALCQQGYASSLYVKDPDGNTVELRYYP